VPATLSTTECASGGNQHPPARIFDWEWLGQAAVKECYWRRRGDADGVRDASPALVCVGRPGYCRRPLAISVNVRASQPVLTSHVTFGATWF